MTNDQVLMVSNEEFVEDMRVITAQRIRFDLSQGTTEYSTRGYRIVIRPLNPNDKDYDKDYGSSAVVAMETDKQLPLEAEPKARLCDDYSPRPMRQTEHPDRPGSPYRLCKAQLAEDKTGVLELFPVFTDEVDPRIQPETYG